jgi:hypothetical protein
MVRQDARDGGGVKGTRLRLGALRGGQGRIQRSEFRLTRHLPILGGWSAVARRAGCSLCRCRRDRSEGPPTAVDERARVQGAPEP